MRHTKNISGVIFGKWTVLSMVIPKKNKAKWICKCACGCIKEVFACHLLSGKSNGCKRCATGYHGLTNTPEWYSWTSMKMRCNTKSHIHYDRYGGRGIKVCDRWQNSFLNFLDDMGKRPKGMSLDRLDSNKGYYKDNCKWSTHEEQQNNICTNRKFIFDSKIYTLAELSRELCINYNTLYSRIERNVGGAKKLYVEI